MQVRILPPVLIVIRYKKLSKMHTTIITFYASVEGPAEINPAIPITTTHLLPNYLMAMVYLAAGIAAIVGFIYLVLAAFDD